MIRKIFKQIWASKGENGWIFSELLVVFIATWLVMDPLYTLMCQSKLFPYGFEPEKVFCLEVGYLPSSAPNFRAENDTQEAIMQDISLVLSRVRALPQVLAATPVGAEFIYSGSFSGTKFRNVRDTAKITNVQYMQMYCGSDYFKVFRFRDAATGRYDLLDEIPYVPNGVFITEYMEEQLFGKGKGIGQEVQLTQNLINSYKVIGVLENVKGQAALQQGSVMFRMQPDYRDTSKMVAGHRKVLYSSAVKSNYAHIIFRINEKVDNEIFISDFQREALPQLSVGNVYVKDIASLQSMGEEQIYEKGITGKIRTQTSLVFFFLVNIALAVFATFWLRIKKRRSEIGVMMAVGASRKNVRNQLLLESLLLLGAAAVAGIVLLLQLLYFKGMYSYVEGRIGEVVGAGWPAGFVNNPFVHFGMVTLLVLLVIGVMVVLGTLLPAQRASRIRPAEALKEE